MQSQNEGSLAQLVQSIPIYIGRVTVQKSIIKREFSSAGSEHLPYKQRVTGSNPVTPTQKGLAIAGPFLVKISLYGIKNAVFVP